MHATPRWIVALALCGCQSVGSASETADRGLRATIDRLYAAFCFDPLTEPDWSTQRAIYLDGATFVPPSSPDRPPVGEDTETFLEGFGEFARSGEYAESGLHERIVGMELTSFGGIAHAFVAFEGFVPDGSVRPPAVTRGLDSIQFVRDGERWRLVSFATQYETGELRVPARFARGD